MISITPANFEFAAFFFDIAAKGFLLLTLAFAVMLCLRCHSAATRHFVLSLTLSGLLLLPLLSLTLPQWSVLPSWLGVRSSGAVDIGDFGNSLRERFSSSSSQRGTFEIGVDGPRQTIGSFPPASESSPLSARSWSLSRWIITIWLFGAFCAIAPAIAGLVSLRILQRRSQPIQSGPLLALLHELKANISYRGNVLLLTSTVRSMPMIWGIFHPRILLPEGAVDWPEERQRVVLLHELAHLQRHDFATTLLARFACAIHWFNPLAWIAAHRISREQEQACDDIVLRTGTEPEDYAEEVLQFASTHNAAALESLSAVAMARSSSLEGRLLAILDDRRNRTSLTRTKSLITALLISLTIIPMSMVRGAQTTGSSAPSGSSFSGVDRGLIAWWKAEDDGKDSAGNHDGTFPFGESYWDGIRGRSFNFLRSFAIEDQLRRVSIPDSPDFQLTEEMTLEAWIFPVKYGGIVFFRGDDRGGLDAWQIDLMTDGRITFGFNTADNQGIGISAPIQLNQAQHIAAVFDHGAMKLYVNSILAAQKQTDLRPITVLDKDAAPALGIGNVGGKYYSMPFNGLIDEVRVYNRALSEAEIEARMRY